MTELISGTMIDHWRRCQRLPDRFWAKVDKTDTCWLWTGSTNGRYGQFSVDGKTAYAHRVSWVVTNGPLPEGRELDHLCRVHRCVRPDHLEPVTRRENLLRGETLAASNAAKLSCKFGHLFDSRNTRIAHRPAGPARVCRACDRRRARQIRERRKRALAGID